MLKSDEIDKVRKSVKSQEWLAVSNLLFLGKFFFACGILSTVISFFVFSFTASSSSYVSNMSPILYLVTALISVLIGTAIKSIMVALASIVLSNIDIRTKLKG